MSTATHVPETSRFKREELSADDARRRKIATGDLVTVGSNGSAITLPARINRRLRAGIDGLLMNAFPETKKIPEGDDA